MKKKRLVTLSLVICMCASLFAFGIACDNANTTTKALADEVTYTSLDEPTVYDLWDVAQEMDFTSGADKNRNLGELSETQNVAFKAKLFYDKSSKKVMIINFLMGHTDSINNGPSYYLQDCGYLFYFRDGNAKLVYQGDGTEGNQLKNVGAELSWSDLSSKLKEIDNLDGTGKINVDEWRYGREQFTFEMGYVKAYTDGEWTGNYVYVKINDVEIMHFVDTSNYYKTKGGYLGKGATGYDYTYYTLSTTYTTLPGVETLDNIRAVKTAIEELPEAQDVVWADKEKVENARKAYDALTDNEKGYIRDVSRLTAAEKFIWFIKGNGAPALDDVKVYDLFDLSGESSRKYTNASSTMTRTLGYFNENTNVAVSAKITFEDYDFEALDNRTSLFFDLVILEKGNASSAKDYGYLLRWRDNQIHILANMNYYGLAKSADTVGISVGKTSLDLTNESEFTVEFGCAKYIAYNEWYANYVYVKINGEEVSHFIDYTDGFKDKGNLVKNGPFTDWNEYTFNSLYDLSEITVGEVAEGVTLVKDKKYTVPLNTDYKFLIPIEYGYGISSVKIDGNDVTDKIVITQDGYALDCSTLTCGGVISIETQKKQVDITVVENQNVMVDIENSADMLSIMNAKIATKEGYVLTSFKINGEEYVDELILGNDGYYYCKNVYKFLSDVTIETQTVEKTYSAVAYKVGEGTVELSKTSVGAFGQLVLTITPANNYYIAEVLLNGEKANVNAEGKVIIERVTQDMQFNVRFTTAKVADGNTENATSGCSSFVNGSSITVAVVALAVAAVLFVTKRKKLSR